MSTKKKRRRPLAVDLGQTFIRWFCRFFLFLVYRIRVHNVKHYPDDQGMLICSNHQSYLDPLIIGIACPHAVNYLGRKSLFRSPILAWFLRFNDTIPIDREATGIGGMKETLRRLKRGESVVIFPEGTRTIDGELLPLMLGFCA
ncbi:MAG: 1-acyl-sn-glycerol-3-phosphate acyltransferase, partial [Planctomycetaceae bacterium]|nr:1-acyl-sn-glycerol-3-phosphate acyltransferase [Planctomycetaceae bacterium]